MSLMLTNRSRSTSLPSGCGPWATEEEIRLGNRSGPLCPRWRRSTYWPRWVPGASTSTTMTWSPPTRRQRSGTRSQRTSRGCLMRWVSPCRWRLRTCLRTRRSGMALLPTTTQRCAPTRFGRRCREWTWAPSLARRRTSSGAGARGWRPT